MEFMPEHAPLVVLTFLGSIFAFGAAVLAALLGVFRKHRWLKIGGLAVAALLVAGYALVLLGVSLTSHEKTLARGEWKYFCEIDCHVAYSVEDVTEAKALGPETQQTLASGSFFIVRLKTWFDPDTISPHRGNGPLFPNPRRVILVDDHGREYAPSPAGQAALERLRGRATPLTQSLRPGESYSTDLVFDLPADAHRARLFLTNDDSVTHILIGHENAPLHPRIYLGLGPPGSAASQTVSN
jgi:hypothetical protein